MTSIDRRRRGPRPATWIWIVDLLLIVLGVVVGGFGGFDEMSVLIPAAVLYATLGSRIVVRQNGNAIGWLLLLVGTGIAIEAFAVLLVTVLVEGGSSLAPYVAWVADWAFIPTIGPLALIFLLFPDGRPPSPGWRRVGWVIVGGVATAGVAYALTPGPLNNFPDIENPIAIPGAEPILGTVVALATIVTLGASLSTAFALRGRYRRSVGEERQQIRWLAAVGVLAGVLLVIWVITIVVSVALDHDGDGTLDYVVIVLALLALTIGLGVPVAVTVSIFRYRLWDLDLVVKKTAQYGILVAAFVAVAGILLFLASRIVIGGGSEFDPTPVLVVGAILAIAFNLIRSPARHLANRMVYGRRSTPYEVLSEFSDRVGDSYSTDDVLPRMAQLLGEAIGARTTRVWLRVGDELRAEVVWPQDAAPVDARSLAADKLPSDLEGDVFEVRHLGDLLGALTVTMPPNDPMDPSKERLARDMAAQAGLVLRNVALIEDVRESRRRIVTAQDERARALERNIHDGAQQQLVALSVKLRLAEQLVERDPARARELLADLQSDAMATLEDVRDLARGIYPPLLADRGLPAALEAQARRSSLAVTVHPDGVGRYGQDVEAAVYFCCLEALNNAAKYAEASRVEIHLSTGDGELRFEVSDDGRGFDRSVTSYGTGLQGMADRLDSIGGSIDVASAPGEGTRVVGRLPLEGAQR